MARSVRDFKNTLPDNFRHRSDRHSAFWQKLNQLGGRRIDEVPPEECQDIDATVPLTDGEWDELAAERDRLL